MDIHQVWCVNSWGALPRKEYQLPYKDYCIVIGLYFYQNKLIQLHSFIKHHPETGNEPLESHQIVRFSLTNEHFNIGNLFAL